MGINLSLWDRDDEFPTDFGFWRAVNTTNAREVSCFVEREKRTAPGPMVQPETHSTQRVHQWRDLEPRKAPDDTLYCHHEIPERGRISLDLSCPSCPKKEQPRLGDNLDG